MSPRILAPLRRAYLLVALAALLLLGLGLFRRAPTRRPPAPGHDRFAVASENGLATRAGIQTLRAGGNAVDAAVAIALLLGVVEPESSGIGGGGFAMVFRQADKKLTVLDFRETAPATLDPAALDVRPKPPRPAGRGRMIGVPGEVAGLVELHRRFGRLSLADDATPAIERAERGFTASRHLAQLALAYHEELAWSPGLRALYKPGDWAVRLGHRLRNPKLGTTLRAIASEGRRAFYEGKVATEIARAAEATGGTLTEDDLRAYEVVERHPLSVSWEGYVVHTMPPPSAGGLLLAETLGLFGKDELVRLGVGTGAYDHMLAEAFRGAIADRMRWIGDPMDVRVDVPSLLEKSRLDKRRAAILLDRSESAPHFALEEHGTTHFVVVDEEGDIVSLTTTVNAGFGAFVETETTGVLLNNELFDFTTSQVDRLYRAEHGGPNLPRPRARPTSSMTPTIVTRGGVPVLALGGSGGLWIAAGTTEALLSHLAFGLPLDQCVSIPRFHTPADAGPLDGPVLEIDDFAPDDVVRDLRSRGEVVRLVPSYSAVQMIAIARGPGGARHLSAAADPRKGAVALVE